MLHVIKYRKVSRPSSLGPLAAKSWGQFNYGMRVLEARLGIIKMITTLTASVVFFALMPMFLTVYAVIKIWRSLVRAWVLRRLTGVQELTGVTLNSALDSTQAPATSTLLLCLKGEVSVQHIQDCIKKDIVGQLDEKGQLHYPNFRRQLVEVMGYYAWRDFPEFTIKNHVVEAARLYRGRSLTERNIQEYISELMSSPIPNSLPPWQIQVVVTHGPEPQTWIMARAHHHLAAQISLPSLFKTAIPDPWQRPTARSQNVLTAPASLRRLGRASKIWIRSVLSESATYFTVVKNTVRKSVSAFNNDVRDEMKQASQSKENPFSKKIVLLFLSIVNVLWNHFLFVFKTWLGMNINDKLTKNNAIKMISSCILNIFIYLYWLIYNLAILPWTLTNWTLYAYAWILLIWNSEQLDLLLKASVEVYWLVRAFVSLPRLLLEEAFSLKEPPVSLGWTGRKRTFSSSVNGSGLIASWSDDVPLSTAHGVKGATGATMSEVLLTATSGALRDYFRNTGLPVPDTLNCTVPVFSQREADMKGKAKTNPGLVSLAFPTGATDAQAALRSVRSTMNKVRRYPEKHLAQVWFLKNIVDFIPKKLLSKTLKMLTGRYPVLLTKLVGPKTPVQFWDHDLINIYYWRPPQAHAALSMCITSYCGRANLGVLGNRHVVSSTSILTQAFVTHLNELAVDNGVKLERINNRKISRCWSRSWSHNSSPGSTPPASPSPTPPSTPTHTRTRRPSTPVQLL
ncbi:unnamed protein product [Meganyctiphanes norvegica]|uniref:Diacylglycerol O-acyltransferase n=1 Tax=Meganyctiphanes norvegica TaxID=48144 RepID=A0AAV2RXT6_MEGNR